MKSKVRTCIVIITLIAIMTFLASSCFKQDSKVNEKTITIQDMLDRSVEVPEKVDGVVGIWIGALRTIAYLESTDKVLGISDNDKKMSGALPYLIAHPELKELPIVQTSEAVNEEEIIRLAPDVIIVSYYTHEGAEKLQQKTNIPVVVVKPGEGESEPLDYKDDKNDFYQSLRIVAKILDKEERAEEIVSYLKDMVDDLEQKTKDITQDGKPAVYIGGLSRKGSHGITMTQRRYPPFVLTYSNNVAGGIEAPSNTIEIDPEQLIEWDPDILFLDAVNLGEVLDNIEGAKFSGLSAVKNGDVFSIFPYPRYGLNHGIVFADSYYVGKILYKDQFTDIEPETKADEIFSFLVGKSVYDTMKESMDGFEKLGTEE